MNGFRGWFVRRINKNRYMFYDFEIFFLQKRFFFDIMATNFLLKGTPHESIFY